MQYDGDQQLNGTTTTVSNQSTGFYFSPKLVKDGYQRRKYSSLTSRVQEKKVSGFPILLVCNVSLENGRGDKFVESAGVYLMLSNSKENRWK